MSYQETPNEKKVTISLVPIVFSYLFAAALGFYNIYLGIVAFVCITILWIVVIAIMVHLATRKTYAEKLKEHMIPH